MLRKMRSITMVMMCAGLLGAAGCATAPPPELRDARQAYNEAKAGPASELAPADLHQAWQALRAANMAFEESSDSQLTKDLAYIALRKSQIARAQAAIELAMRNQKEADRQFADAQAQLQNQTRQELEQAQGQVAQLERQRELDAQQFSTQQQLSSASQELERERQARLQAEQRANEAMQRLEAQGSVRQEQRGTVITVPGNVLFSSGNSNLMEGAQVRIREVADALRGTTTQNIIVEGHTDSVGSETYNMGLSQKRAQAVKDYLVTLGLPSERVRAVGMGEDHPVASNDTTEGRTLNRRVEIIIEQERATTR